MDRADLVDDIARATGFLGRLPVPGRFFDGHDGRLGRAARAFPLAGLIVTAPPALVVLALSAIGVEPALVAVLALAAGLLATGALHEDGLADCFDAFGAGGKRDHVLAVLKDSRIGTYGALALLVSVSLRLVALAVLVAALPALAAALLVLAAGAWSRALMVGHWDELPPARANGVAVSVGAPEPGTANVALALGGAIALVAALGAAGLFSALVATAGALLAVRFWTGYVSARLAGHTGDTIGAAQQIGEIAWLVLLAISA